MAQPTVILSLFPTALSMPGILVTEEASLIKQYQGLDIETARMCRNILKKCDKTLERVQKNETTVKQAVKEAYEEKQAENGHLSTESMKDVFQKFKGEMKRNVQAEINAIQSNIKKLMTLASGNTSDHEDDQGMPTLDDEDPQDYSPQPGKSYGNFAYNGRLHWHVPKDFKFPQELNLTTGWGLWTTGMPSKRICPFRLFNKESLPPHIHSQFLLHWKPTFDIMECVPDMDKESICANFLTAGAITESLQKGQAYLRTDRLLYVFANPRKNKNPATWALSVHLVKALLTFCCSQAWVQKRQVILPDGHMLQQVMQYQSVQAQTKEQHG